MSLHHCDGVHRPVTVRLHSLYFSRRSELDATLASADWRFAEFNTDVSRARDFLREHEDAGNTSVPNRQNRALLFDSMLFHQSDPFRFKRGRVEEKRSVGRVRVFPRATFFTLMRRIQQPALSYEPVFEVDDVT